ncbi:hypothetical protein E2562_013384 [Oryza meyeriana var. granulata]|uniref:Uncharacterized protein n=1 Tax=Oryza meyeriana var. granulata TaxID=110450 RepID=A0A6G1CEV9_9ORYZ|nr:hypothetical protein E2562_013384 [Oryza meyeriana var. granulata]
MGLSRFSHWIWPGSRTRRAREPPVSSTATAMADALFPDSPSGFREPETVRTPSSGGGSRGTRKGTNRRHSGEVEARVDREHDMVIVPSDVGDGYLSDTGSDDSDWSIGWLEPQGPELHSDGDSEGSFAVLVPCYRHGRRVEETSRGRLADGNVSDGKNFVERWLSSLPN